MLDSFTYTLTDTPGGISRVTMLDGGYWSYVYDDRGRLTSGMRKNSGNTLLDWYTYGYDAGDNMSQRARYNAQSGTTDT